MWIFSCLASENSHGLLKGESLTLLTPSYSELMKKINTDKLVDNKITSRYTIVLAVAKRARQIIDGADPLTYAPTDRAVSIAVKEMGEGKITINVEEDQLDESYERMLQNISAVSKDDLREDLKDTYDPISYAKDDDDEDYDQEIQEDAYLYDEEEKFEDDGAE